jgi:hypothetical protein
MSASSSPEQPLPEEVNVKLPRSFVRFPCKSARVAGYLTYSPAISVCSDSDERLNDSWNTLPTCVLAHLSSLLFSSHLAGFTHFLILRTAKLGL